MKKDKDDKAAPLADEVELVVTQEEYEEGLRRGWTDEEMLKPGRYKVKRGGFLKRHPQMESDDRKRA